MANARGRGKAGAHRSSPARTAALIGGAALLLLVGGKLAGLLTREPGRDWVARTGGMVGDWLRQGMDGVEVTSTPHTKESPAAMGLVTVMKSLGIQVPEIQREVLPEIGTGRREAERWRVPLPGRLSPVQANLAVTQAATGLGLDVLDAWEASPSMHGMTSAKGVGRIGGKSDGKNSRGGANAEPTLTMVLGRAREASYRLEFVRHDHLAGNRIAIVIDDFGLVWDETAEAFLDFPAPLSLGVLPGYKSSRQVADAARSRGFEVLLHLPMEPERYPQVKPGPGAILVDQTTAEMRATMRRALRSLGKVAGVSSHMGSRATTDRDVMRTILDETGRQDLVFIDTHTTPHSVVAEVGRQMGVPVLLNRVFLDQKRERRSIAAQLDDAMKLAEEMGEVVVVAHGYRETLSALTDALPVLKARGIELVFVSELARAKRPAPA